MSWRRRRRTAAKHKLVTHEFAVVLAHGSRCGCKSGVAEIGRGSPPPSLAEALHQSRRHTDSMLPFGFGRQPRARPARVGIGLKKTDMTHRRIQIERPRSVQRKFGPCATLFPPVQRCAPPVVAHTIPAVRQPQIMPRIAPVCDELKVLAIADKPICDLVGAKEDLMTRRFVVKRKLFAVMSDFNKTACECRPRD
jgi:hypothetical protein